VRADAGVTLAEVVLIKRGTLPKTSSGKVRRREAKARLANNTLEMLEASIPPPPMPRPRASSPATV